MKVWTVTSQDDHPKYGPSHCAAGTYTSRERALDECVDYIMERLKMREDLVYCMAFDDNHPEAAEFFSGESDRSDRWRVKRGKKTALRKFLRDELDGQGCYYAFCDCGIGWLSFHFDVDESDVEGELWHTVTWGSSDCEEPEFTTPWPETFTNKESAIKSFYQYALDLKRQYEVEVSEGLKPYVYDSLRKNGKCQIDLGDGCCVNCVLYHDDAKNILE